MVKLNRIYTRTGDDGTTGLVDGSRLPKHAPRMEAIGAIDETNSAIGLAICALGEDEQASALLRIQNDLFDLGADLATPLGDVGGQDFTPSEMVLRIVPEQVAWLEQAIDAVNEALSPLTRSPRSQTTVTPPASEATPWSVLQELPRSRMPEI